MPGCPARQPAARDPTASRAAAQIGGCPDRPSWPHRPGYSDRRRM